MALWASCFQTSTFTNCIIWISPDVSVSVCTTMCLAPMWPNTSIHQVFKVIRCVSLLQAFRVFWQRLHVGLPDFYPAEIPRLSTGNYYKLARAICREIQTRNNAFQAAEVPNICTRHQNSLKSSRGKAWFAIMKCYHVLEEITCPFYVRGTKSLVIAHYLEADPFMFISRRWFDQYWASLLTGNVRIHSHCTTRQKEN